MKRILVSMDLTLASSNGAAYAIKLARSLQMDVLLGYSIHLEFTQAYQPTATGVTAPDPQAYLSTELFKQAEKQFQDFVEKLPLAKTSEVKIDKEVTVETHAHWVKQQTKDADQEVALVILPAEKSHSFIDRIFNTENNEIIEASRAPVMVIPQDMPFKPIEKILYATDHQPRDVSVLKNLAGFAKKMRAMINALHISKSMTGEGDGSPTEESKLKSDTYKELGNDRGLLKHTTQYADDTAEGIMYYAQAFNADLIAMLKEKHGLFVRLFDESITDKVKKKTMRPVLIYTDKML